MLWWGQSSHIFIPHLVWLSFFSCFKPFLWQFLFSNGKTFALSRRANREPNFYFFWSSPPLGFPPGLLVWLNVTGKRHKMESYCAEVEARSHSTMAECFQGTNSLESIISRELISPWVWTCRKKGWWSGRMTICMSCWDHVCAQTLASHAPEPYVLHWFFTCLRRHSWEVWLIHVNVQPWLRKVSPQLRLRNWKAVGS